MNTKKVLTLCLIHQHPRILLGMKKKGFGMGRFNGFGGKVERGESIVDAAKREVLEESGLLVSEIDHVGILEFVFKDDPVTLEVHVFKAISFNGDPTESDEMKPQWFSVDEIPFKNMWPDDVHWFPLFLSGKKFKGTFSFEDHDTIVDQHIAVVDTF